MTSQYAYGFLQFMARISQVANITPAEYGYSMTAGQKGYYEYLLGFVQQFQPGRPVPTVALGMNSKISTDLAPFKVNGDSIPVVAGIAPYPGDFRYLALMTDSNNKKLEWISDNKLPGRLGSVIDPITDTGKGFYNEGATGWNIYPVGTITPVIINYYKKPLNVSWGYTLNAQGRPVYDPTQSQDPQFGDSAMTEVLARACKLLGFSFQSENLVQYAEEVIVKGE